ncbi:hypothetical protein MPER_15986, partial [Moniliophthora perniciosa FA553]
RALRYNWTGRPTTNPSIELIHGKSSLLSIFASWNGATDIQRWELFGASDAEGTNAVSLYNRTKTGYETTITIPTNLEKYDEYTHFAVRALDGGNEPLGRSDFVSLNGVMKTRLSSESSFIGGVVGALLWAVQSLTYCTAM